MYNVHRRYDEAEQFSLLDLAARQEKWGETNRMTLKAMAGTCSRTSCFVVYELALQALYLKHLTGLGMTYFSLGRNDRSVLELHWEQRGKCRR